MIEYEKENQQKFRNAFGKILKVIVPIEGNRINKLINVKLIDKLHDHVKVTKPKDRYRQVIQITGKGKKRYCYNPCPQLKAVQREANTFLRKFPRHGVTSFSVKDVRNIVRTKQ